MATSSATKISQLYVSLFGRAPDSAGLAFWTEALDGGSWTFASIAKSMFDTAPARAYYPAGATAEAVVTTFYTNVLGRAPDAEGLAFWVKEYTAAGKDQGAFFAKLITNVVDYTGTDAAGLKSKNLFANKVTVAEFYGNNGGSIAGATAALTGVTEVASTVDTAKTAILNPVVAGQTFTLTTSSTPDLLVGTAGNDTFSGDKLTFSAGNDQIVDQSSTDNDAFNLSVAVADIAATSVTRVENINVTLASTSAPTANTGGVDADKFTGVKNLTITRSDVSVGGSSIAGDKAVQAVNVNSANVAAVTAGTGTTTVTVLQKTKAGATVNADAASGNTTVTGAATVAASGAGAGDTVTVTGFDGTATGAATENKKAVSVTTNAATVSIADGANTGKFTGAISVTANGADSITIANATGGATVSATRASDATANTTINITNIDDSGATITAGTGTSTTPVLVNIDGTSATTDAATIKAAGSVTLDTSLATTDTVDNLNLSGNGAAVTYTLSSPEAGAATTKFTLSGDQSVTLVSTTAALTLTTVTDTTTAGSTKVKLTTVATADLSKVASDSIEVAATGSSAALTVANGANVILAADQTTAVSFVSADAEDVLNLSTGDDNGASTATPDITTGTLTLSSFAGGSNAKATVNIDATVGKLTLSTATTGGTATVINVKGTQDVALGTVTAKSVDASGSSGKISLTSTTGVTTVTTGSGVDTLTANGAAVHNFDAGAGNDIVYINATSAAAQFVGGAGDDTISVNTATGQADGAIVVSGGDGNDTVKIGLDSSAAGTTGTTDAILIGGDGTDTLYIEDTGTTLDLSAKTNFAMSGFETLDITDLDGTFTVSAKQFANNKAIALKGSSNDILAIKAASTGSTIDASGITYSSGSTATVSFTTGAKADTVTGTSKADAFSTSLGADILDGGAGKDSIDLAGMIATNETGSAAANGAIINLGTTAVAATSILGKVSLYTAQSLTSVAAGTAAYGFTTDAATNSSVVKTLSNLESITGTSGADYIVASNSDGTITGLGGNDYIKLGDGVDTVVTGSTAASADSVAGFATGIDKLDLSAPLAAATLTIGTQVAYTAVKATNIAAVTTAADTDAEVYYIKNTAGGAGAMSIAEIETAIEQGTAATGQATILIDNGTDTLVYFDSAAQTDSSGAGMILVATLVGVTGATALATGDLISV